MTTLLLTLACLIGALCLAGWVGTKLIERRYPPVGAFIEVDGLRLHYLAAGEGPAVVLLHGASSNLRDFRASILPLLARGHRVIAFDRPGLGYSARPRGSWPTPARVAALVLDAAERLGAERPVMVGHSWSGSVVMAALVEMPQRVAGGVLLAGVSGHWAGEVSRSYALARRPLLGRLFAYALVPSLGVALMPLAIRQILAPSPVPDAYARRIGAALALRSRHYLHNAQDMNRLSDYLQTLSTRYPQIRAPLLAIHGDGDTVVPFWNHAGRLRHLLPQLELLRLPGVGHAPHHSEPEAVAEAIAGFVQRTLR